MPGPDGPESREAEREEHYERDLDDLDVAEQIAEDFDPERAALIDAGRGQHLVRQ